MANYTGGDIETTENDGYVAPYEGSYGVPDVEFDSGPAEGFYSTSPDEFETGPAEVSISAPPETGTTYGSQVGTPSSYIDPAVGTVSGQMSALLEKNHPLMKQAAARADLASTRQGLGGTSMAQRAAQGAMVGAMLPIAQQDASTYAGMAQNQQQFDMQNQMNEIAQGYQKELMNKEWNLNTRTLLTGLFGQMNTQFMNEMGAIVRTPDMPQSTVDSYKDVYNKQMKSMFDIINYDNWDWAKI